MAELLVSNPTNQHYHQHLVFPDLELLHPPPLVHPAFSNALRPFRRGPLYSTYAELRDRTRRLKKIKYAPSTPIPLPLKRPGAPCSVDRCSSLSKENRRPPTRFDNFMTPPPHLASKRELRKSVSLSVGRMEQRKSSHGRLFSPGRGFSARNDLKEISMPVSVIKLEGRGERFGSRASLRKSTTCLDRWKSTRALG